MDRSSALTHLKAGRKVRNVNWPPNEHMRLVDGHFKMSDGHMLSHLGIANIFCGNEFELCREKVCFETAAKLIQAGGVATRYGRVMRDAGYGQISVNHALPTIDDICTPDWVVEG